MPQESTAIQNPVQVPVTAGGQTSSPNTTGNRPLLFTQASYKIPKRQAQMAATGLAFGSSYSGQIAADGFLHGLIVTITASGGSGSNTAAVASADAPWNVIGTLTLSSPGGTKPLTVVDGYSAYLVTKYGGYNFGDPAVLPSFSNVATSGNFTFKIYVPVALSDRTALGALANMNSGSLFTLNINFNPASVVYSTVPAPTVPTLSVTVDSINWTLPAQRNSIGQLQETSPPLLGLTQYWTTNTSPTLAAGTVDYINPRVGNVIRNIFVITRSAGARAALINGLTRITLNNTEWKDYWPDQWIDENTTQYGAPLPVGVYAIPLCTDLDGRPGNELRQQWLATTTATKMEFLTQFSASGQITLLVNDVAIPAGDNYLTGIRL